MTNKEALDIIDAVKGYCNYDITVYYPLVSYMCQVGYITNWECIDDVFYIDGKQIAPDINYKEKKYYE